MFDHARIPARLQRVPAVLAAALVIGIPAAHSQESASYVMERVTISSTSDVASSTSFDLAVTFGQEGPVGSVSVCNAGAFQSTGFWSVAGDPPAPIFLDVVRDKIDPGGVQLSWTGSASLYEIFRGEMASSVPVPGNSLMGIPDGSIRSLARSGQRHPHDALRGVRRGRQRNAPGDRGATVRRCRRRTLRGRASHRSLRFRRDPAVLADHRQRRAARSPDPR